jgi:hypothetical protein
MRAGIVGRLDEIDSRVKDECKERQTGEKEIRQTLDGQSKQLQERWLMDE